MNRYEGGCHCGNLSIEMQMRRAPGEVAPLACDCDFCTRHAGAYVSDPKGTLEIAVRDEAQLSRYRHGAKVADFLVCRNCGALVAVCYGEGASLFATVNARAVAGSERFAPLATVSPKKLEVGPRIEIWKKAWFPGVRVRIGPGSSA